jgi:hypothetical protein
MSPSEGATRLEEGAMSPSDGAHAGAPSLGVRHVAAVADAGGAIGASDDVRADPRVGPQRPQRESAVEITHHVSRFIGGRRLAVGDQPGDRCPREPRLLYWAAIAMTETSRRGRQRPSERGYGESRAPTLPAEDRS